MRRVTLVALIALVAAACTSEATPPTTEGRSTTSTGAPTTTTVPQPPLIIRNAGQALTDVITALYSGDDVAAPKRIKAKFRRAAGEPPADGVASVAQWGKGTRMAVVDTGPDVTLLVADPEWRVVGGWWPSMKIKPDLGRFPKIIAVVGSDARPDEPQTTTRSDSIHILAMDGKGNAALAGIPRDSWVPIPGVGTNKINSALYYGGPELMMSTFGSVTGLHFDGYVLTGFAGFEDLIGVLGGLLMDVPQSFNDTAAQAFISAGMQVLDPAQALGLSRTRKTLAAGDFSRQENGGKVLIAAQSMARAYGPLGLPNLLSKSRPAISTDMSLDELLVLSAAILRVSPDNITNVVAPGSAGSAGSASVVYLSSSASALWEDLADGKLQGS
jgi:LCP family protein required for cell wall assembly